MKLLVLFSVSLLSTLSFADTYKCAEKAKAALEEGRLQYSVIIKEGKKITDPKIIGENDAASYVTVSVLSRDPEVGGRFELDRPSFRAIATYEDVNFDIDAKKEHGFNFHIYFDELDQSSLSLKGVKKSIQMTCTGDKFN